MDYEIGASVRCSDGSAGSLVALIANPLRRALAHIAVEVEHEPTGARLVPLHLVSTINEDGVQLDCSLKEFSRLPEFHDVEFIPYSFSGDPNATLAWPYYGMPAGEVPAIIDRVPADEVEIRRGDHVRAADGAVGSVEGLVVDDDGQITHVLLQEGHLWGRKEVAIPIGSVDAIDPEGIHVRLTKRELADLPEFGVGQEEPPPLA
jgi:hypothetical protein